MAALTYCCNQTFVHFSRGPLDFFPISIQRPLVSRPITKQHGAGRVFCRCFGLVLPNATRCLAHTKMVPLFCLWNWVCPDIQISSDNANFGFNLEYFVGYFDVLYTNTRPSFFWEERGLSILTKIELHKSKPCGIFSICSEDVACR